MTAAKMTRPEFAASVEWAMNDPRVAAFISRADFDAMHFMWEDELTLIDGNRRASLTATQIGRKPAVEFRYQDNDCRVHLTLRPTA